MLREIASGDALAGVLAVVLAVLVGSLMIALTDERVRDTAAYVFARPGDFFTATWDAIWGAYTALFRGAIYNDRVDGFATQIRPLTETLKFAGAAHRRRARGRPGVPRRRCSTSAAAGQMLLAGAAAGWVGVQARPADRMHLPLAIVAGMVAGALWAGIAGVLKARTGRPRGDRHDHAQLRRLLPRLLRALQAEPPAGAGLGQPQVGCPTKESATLPKLLGDRFNLHLGFLLALVAVAVVWWLLNRSALGFRIRAVGENPSAARAAGIDVGRTYVVVMLIAGALVGLAGANQVLGTVTSGVTVDLDAGIGFDAITVALLGRSRPLGILGCRTALRRVQGGRLRHAGLRGHPGRHRAGRPVAHRALHRRTAPGPRDLPAAREGGEVSTTVAAPTLPSPPPAR